MNLETVVAVAGLMATIIAILGTVFGWFGKAAVLWRGYRQRSLKLGVPKKTLALQRSSRSNAISWNLATLSENRPGIQIVADLLVTNITDRRVLITNVDLRGFAVEQIVFMVKDAKTGMSSLKTPIPAAGVAEVRIVIFAAGQPFEKGEPFSARLLVLDQFGNRHRTPMLTIEGV